MEYNNYGSNEARRRSANQNPYLRPQDNNASRPASAQTRHNRVHNPGRYGSILEELSLPMVEATGTLHTADPSGYRALQYQTPFTSNQAALAQHNLAPRTLYSAPSTMDFSGNAMLPPGTAAIPQHPYEPYPGKGRYAAASTSTQYDNRMDMYEQFAEYDSSLLMPPMGYQENSHQASRSVSEDMLNKSYGQVNPAAYKPFMLPYSSSDIQQNFETTQNLASYNCGNTAVISPDHRAAENQMKFSQLSITHKKQPIESTSNNCKEIPPGFNMTNKLRTEPKKELPQAPVKPPVRIFSGPIGKMLTWDSLLQGHGQDMLYEVIAPLAGVQTGASVHEKVLLLREKGMPVVQCTFTETDRPLPRFTEEQLIRCVGKMMSKNKMRVFSVRAATVKEKACLDRLQYICNRVGNEVTAGSTEM